MATSLTLNYTGNVKTYQVAENVKNGIVNFNIIGGGGGGGGADANGRGGNASAGRVVIGTFNVKSGDIIEIAVGGGGQRGRTGGSGGAGGGSFSEYAGGHGADQGPVGASGGGGGGGGATVIKLNGRAIAIASGGGGGGGGSWQRSASSSDFSEGGSSSSRGQNGGYLTGGTTDATEANLPYVRDGGGGGGGGGGHNGGRGGRAGTDHTSYTGGDGGRAGNRGSSWFSTSTVNAFTYTGPDYQTTGYVSNIYGYGGRGASAGAGGEDEYEYKRYSQASFNKWSQFMNSYAIWRNNNFFEGNTTFSASALRVEFPSGPVTLRYAADNNATISVDGVQVASTGSNFNGYDDVVIESSPGQHTISWSVTNIGGSSGGNPGGIAIALYKGRTPTNQPFWHSRKEHLIGISYAVGSAQDNATDGQSGVAIMNFNLTPRDINVKISDTEWARVQEVYVKEGGTWVPCEDVLVKKNNQWTKALYRGRFTVSFTNGSGWGTGGVDGPARNLDAPPRPVVSSGDGGDQPASTGGGGGGGCKIICTKLHELGYLPDEIFVADQLFGEWLRENDPYAYYGYIKWASVVVDWMDKDGPQCMFWIRDKKVRNQKQQEMAIKWAKRIATPWAQHMAYKMGVLKEDNRAGRTIMKTGLFISRLIGKLTKAKEPTKSPVIGYLMWATFGVFWLMAGLRGK